MENQLKRVTKDGAEVASFKYDPLGRRVEKVAGGIAYSYLYDGMDILRETKSDGTTYTYVHGPGIDEPLARIDQAGTVAYYHADGLGSIFKITDSTGSVIDSRQYDAWGNHEVGEDQPGFSFTGREWDPETGLYYYRARYYDPKVGRFISADPAGGIDGPNLYLYAQASPVVWSDPFGLATGHHYFPQSIWRNISGLSADAYAFFDKATTGPIPGGHDFTDHGAYNKAVKDLWTKWTGANRIDPAKMTAQQADRFIREIARSTDPRITRVNRMVHHAQGTYMACRVRKLGRMFGRVAKIILIGSAIYALATEGAEAAVDQTADDLAWPLPVSQMDEDWEASRRAGQIIGQGLSGGW